MHREVEGLCAIENSSGWGSVECDTLGCDASSSSIICSQQGGDFDLQQKSRGSDDAGKYVIVILHEWASIIAFLPIFGTTFRSRYAVFLPCLHRNSMRQRNVEMIR